MIGQPIIRSVPAVIVERGAEAAEVPATVVGAAVKNGEAKTVKSEDVGHDVVDALVDFRFLVGGAGDGGVQTVGGLLTENHDHHEENRRELRRAPYGLSSTRDTVCRGANTELLPRANQSAPVGPLPEGNDTCGAKDGHDGRGIEHETSSVPGHERGSKDPHTEHQGGAVAVSKASPQETATHDESQQEGDGAKRGKELGSVWSVGFCNGTEDLGFGKVAATGEQDVPRIGEVQRLQHVKQHEEHRCNTTKRSKDQQPRLVSESSGDEGDGDREPKDEQEGLEPGAVQHEVELWVGVERQCHQERCGQHHEEHHAKRSGIAASEHVQSDLQGVGQEEDGRTDDEPFPAKGDDAEGHTCQGSVGHGSLAMSGDVLEGTNKGQRVRRGRLGNSRRTSVLHRTEPVHEPDREEQHHKRVVVSQCPCGVRDVSGHEGDEPCSEHASALAEVILGHGGDGEHGQCAIHRRQGEHAPPNGILGGVEEGFECHGTDGHGPREEWRTWVDSTEGVEAVSVNHKVSIVGNDVVDNALHVPRVGTTGHVPVAGAKGVH